MAEERAVVFRTPGLVVPGAMGLRRYVGTPEMPQIDPVLLLDVVETAAHAGGHGFAPHPHRGIDTVTLVVEGAMEHADNLGHRHIVLAGGAQVMRAARGILHAERPAGDGRQRVLQFWFNPSRSERADAPSYLAIDAERVATGHHDGAQVRTVLGGRESPMESWASRPEICDVTLEPGGHLRMPVARGREGLVLVLDGAVATGDVVLRQGHMGRLGAGDVVVVGSETGARFVLATGMPIGEDIVRSGPFVANSRADLLRAYRDYQAGGFGPAIPIPPPTS